MDTTYLKLKSDRTKALVREKTSPGKQLQLIDSSGQISNYDKDQRTALPPQKQRPEQNTKRTSQNSQSVVGNKHLGKQRRTPSWLNVLVGLIALCLSAGLIYGIVVLYNQSNVPIEQPRQVEEPNPSSIEPTVNEEVNEVGDNSALPPRESDGEIAVGAQLASTETVATEPAALLLAASVAFQNGQWAEAIAKYEQLRSLNNIYETETVLQNLSTSYFNAVGQIVSDGLTKETDLDLALTYFQNVLLMKPDDANIKAETELLNTYLSGESALQSGNPQRAIDILLPLYEAQPQYLGGYVGQQLYHAYVDLGDRAMRKGNHEGALKHFEQASAVVGADKSGLEERLTSFDKLFSETSTSDVAASSAPEPKPLPEPEPTSRPTAPRQPILRAPTCPTSFAVITSPREGQVVSGSLSVKGTATYDKLKFYKLEIAPVGRENFSYFDGAERPVNNGTLGVLDTSKLPNGKYTIQVVTVDHTSNYPAPCTVTVSIQNP